MGITSRFYLVCGGIIPSYLKCGDTHCTLHAVNGYERLEGGSERTLYVLFPVLRSGNTNTLACPATAFSPLILTAATAGSTAAVVQWE